MLKTGTGSLLGQMAPNSRASASAYERQSVILTGILTVVRRGRLNSPSSLTDGIIHLLKKPSEGKISTCVARMPETIPPRYLTTAKSLDRGR